MAGYMQYHWPLIGHQPIKEYFARALSSGKINHAYLFYGPAHVGKFTFAKMLAQTLLCDRNVGPGLVPGRGGAPSRGGQASPALPGDAVAVPCEVCRSCTAFAHASHPDYTELSTGEEAHIVIEQARALVVTLSTRPLLSPFRVGIIENAETLTVEAGSALLKTIEEPGAQVVLILTASAPVAPTIASRCQCIRFCDVPASEMEAAFKDMADGKEMLHAAYGRPGRALALKDPEIFSQYREAVREVEQVLISDEGERLLWVSARFGGRAEPAERREACRTFLQTLQEVARLRLAAQPHLAGLLARTIAAQHYLQANVDPRLAAEYVLLNHDTHIP